MKSSFLVNYLKIRFLFSPYPVLILIYFIFGIKVNVSTFLFLISFFLSFRLFEDYLDRHDDFARKPERINLQDAPKAQFFALLVATELILLVYLSGEDYLRPFYIRVVALHVLIWLMRSKPNFNMLTPLLKYPLVLKLVRPDSSILALIGVYTLAVGYEFISEWRAR
jgi:hypothetical protein